MTTLKLVEALKEAQVWITAFHQMVSHPGFTDRSGYAQRLEPVQLQIMDALKEWVADPHSKARPEFLALAESCGATLTGKPDGSEPVTIVFSIEAWRVFDAAIAKS